MAGKYSGARMGGGQHIFSVGHIPRVSGYRKAKPHKSQREKLRALSLYAAEHGLFLKVGPLLYRMGDPAGFFRAVGEVASEDSGGFALRFIHQMYARLGRKRHFVREGYERWPMWVSVAQKAAIFKK
tara:strand:+ start:325 stop:705 length:381 start_codon:yes stop_codon:yes gene_type:complete